MTENHEQIPLLAKLLIYYYCDKCHEKINLGWFYQGIDEAIEAANTEDGKLICSMCRDKPLKDKG